MLRVVALLPADTGRVGGEGNSADVLLTAPKSGGIGTVLGSLGCDPGVGSL